ncbi:hypothetical protein BH10CHL1_BH10CHL1_05050 [soil metagenome]
MWINVDKNYASNLPAFIRILIHLYYAVNNQKLTQRRRGQSNAEKKPTMLFALIFVVLSVPLCLCTSIALRNITYASISGHTASHIT